MIKHTFYFSLTLVMFIISSCANVNHSNQTESNIIDLPVESVQEKNTDYIIQLGDVLDVKFFRHPELNEKQRVRPAGKICLQIIGDTLAVGLTPSELVKILTEKYSKWYHHIDVVTIVQNFSGNMVYVGGEVKTPGPVITFGNLEALEAIFMAGGFKETAHPGSVIIIRKGPDNKQHVWKLNLKLVMSGEAPEENILLKPYHIIYVPKSFIAKANKFVEQYITRMIPTKKHFTTY